MLKNNFFKLGLLLLFVAVLANEAASKSDDINKPVPASVRLIFKRANDLAEREKFAEALAELKKTIAKAPQFLPAHIKYIKVKGYLMGQLEEVKSEYETLMAKNPENPIYPAALGVGLFSESQQTKRGWFEKVIKLAPEWSWSHYAKSQFLMIKEPENAAAELLKMIEKEPAAIQPYTQAIFIQELRLRKIDDAIATAEKLMKQPDFRADALGALWRLRLKKAGSTDEAKAKLRQELSQVAASANDVATLSAVRTAYKDVLKDNDASRKVEEKIARIDASWYPERGVALVVSSALGDKGPYSVAYAGRQLAIANKLREIDFFLETQEQITRVEQLLSLNPDAQIKESIYSRLLMLAQTAEDDALTVKYGEVLLALDPKDVSTLTQVALALANQKRDLDKALRYALLAEELTREFHFVKDIHDLEENKFFQEYYSEKQQEQRYKALRAIALDSSGWVLSRMGKYAEAEPKLRQAIEISRSEIRLSHLAETLRGLNRLDEAERIALEAKNEYAAGIKRKFKNEPAKDFELLTIDGRKVKLSDLKGKVVMINFWATWCKPCIKEMPLFVKAYEKYKERGFEILAITVDEIEDRPKVVSLVNQQKITFPILYDDNIAKLYKVHAYPTTFFIGKEGTIRYENTGLSIRNAERELETVIEELLKDS